MVRVKFVLQERLGQGGSHTNLRHTQNTTVQYYIIKSTHPHTKTAI